MKFLKYYLLCLFAMRMESKPQLTKLFPAEGLTAYYKQLGNTTKSLDKFWEKLRITYNFVFHPDNTNNIEKILSKNITETNLPTLKVIWADMLKADNYTNFYNYSNLKYPTNSFLNYLKSLSTLKNQDSKINLTNLEKNSSVEIETTIKRNENNTNSEEKNSNKTKTLADDDWFNIIQSLRQLELQNKELDKKNNMKIMTPKMLLQFPTMVGHHLVEWFESIFNHTYNIYTKLSGISCDNVKH
ncbi:uncharacterized protein LOC105430885 [Pogonomyrmex barbatus]|uniref:Uncharacterized protein LOC105430885 n=1 Tax=Pogonomyrmex barbatus TaxID=144034 RepID=A0A6I9WIV7_9HYME|nr:uncharacterized protein LOC105430885 [Pogonomyrmex barbatus]